MLKWLPVGMDAKAPMSNAAAAIMVARPCCPAILSILRVRCTELLLCVAPYERFMHKNVLS